MSLTQLNKTLSPWKLNVFHWIFQQELTSFDKYKKTKNPKFKRIMKCFSKKIFSVPERAWATRAGLVLLMTGWLSCLEMTAAWYWITYKYFLILNHNIIILQYYLPGNRDWAVAALLYRRTLTLHHPGNISNLKTLKNILLILFHPFTLFSTDFKCFLSRVTAYTELRNLNDALPPL